MAEDLYDPYIDFGFDDEANYVAPSEDVLSLPASLAAIFETLRPGLPLPQTEEPTTSPPVPDPLYAFPSHNTPTFYQHSPIPSCSLGNALDEVYPATYVRPSDTIYTHGASSSTTTLPPAPSPHQYMPSVGSPRPSHVKRLRGYSDDFSCPEQSLWRKRQRTAPPRTSVAHIGHSFSSINDFSSVAEVMDGAVSREPVIHSPRTWRGLPQPEDSSIAGPSTLTVENALCPRISQKRTWDDENRDRSTTSNKRHKRAALTSVPEVLNAPVVPYYDPSPEGSPYATSAAPGSRFTGLPELTPEFYNELCELAFEVVQDLKQTPNTDGASTYQDLPESSTTAYSAGENSNNQPAPTTTGKRLRTQVPPEPEPPTKRQRTSSPPNTEVLFPATCPRTETSTFQKPVGCPFADDPTPCLQRFTRENDVNRHIRSKHLGVSVFCTSSAHAAPVRVVREDGVFRHLKFNSCIGEAARKKLEAQCEREMAPAKSKNTSSRHWEGKVHKAVSRMFARIQMPCYFRDARFWEALGYLPGWTPQRLEEWFSAYGKVLRCECECCKNISDAELHGKVKIEVQYGPWNTRPRPSPSVGPMIAGPSSAGAIAPTPSPSRHSDAAVISNDGDWDDKLPPEEEEGVDEDLPQVSPPAVAVVAQDNDATSIAMGDLSEAPDLQTVCDILSELSDEDLGAILRDSPYGSQRKVDPTPNRKADA